MNIASRALLATALMAPCAARSLAEPPAELDRWLTPQTWQRDIDGPILSLGAQGAFDEFHIFAPAVVRHRGQFLLWYCGSRGTRHTRVFRLGLATSDDGKAFRRFAGNPVLEFDDGRHSLLTAGLLRTGNGDVLLEDGRLRMWFSSTEFGQTDLHTLHESTSLDGIAWTKPSPALLEHVYCPTVLKNDAGYQMWFTDVSRRPWKLRYATSVNGRQWSVRQQPVLDFTQDWESGILVYPCVLKIDGVYLLWYGSYHAQVKQTTAIGFAVSTDGIHWHKHPQNPVLRPDPTRPWESNYVTSGCVMRLADGSFRYWYASRTKPPWKNLYFAIGTARWSGPSDDTQ